MMGYLLMQGDGRFLNVLENFFISRGNATGNGGFVYGLGAA